MYRGRIKKIHFIGVGGSGMNGIAEVLVNMGYKVTGSDLAESETTKRLRSLGITIFVGHREENVIGADCVVYSSAVKKENPEIREATSRQIPIIPRAEMLAELMRMKYGIAIAGTHGKTTTTSMVSMILAAASMDPTIVTGGKLNSLGANAKLGTGDFLVAEADESDGSFLKLSPTIAVVTNIDREHMDHYQDMEEVKKAFLDFMNKVPFYGCAVICLDHPVIQSLIPQITRRFKSYGLTAQADIHARKIVHDGMKTTYEVWHNKVLLGSVALNLPGEHNVYNSLAAITVASELEIPFDKIKEGLEGFTGVERRFHVRGTVGDIVVVDDYGHHPSEIKATLETVRRRYPDRRIVCVFQPHMASRTKALLHDFAKSFSDVDVVLLVDIFASARERAVAITSKDLADAVTQTHPNASYTGGIEQTVTALRSQLKLDDVIVTMGAGNVYEVRDKLLMK